MRVGGGLFLRKIDIYLKHVGKRGGGSLFSERSVKCKNWGAENFGEERMLARVVAGP